MKYNEEDDLILCIVNNNMKINWFNLNINELDNKCINIYKYLEEYYNIKNITIELCDNYGYELYRVENIKNIIQTNPNRLCLRVFY